MLTHTQTTVTFFGLPVRPRSLQCHPASIRPGNSSQETWRSTTSPTVWPIVSIHHCGWLDPPPPSMPSLRTFVTGAWSRLWLVIHHRHMDQWTIMDLGNRQVEQSTGCTVVLQVARSCRGLETASLRHPTSFLLCAIGSDVARRQQTQWQFLSGKS